VRDLAAAIRAKLTGEYENEACYGGCGVEDCRCSVRGFDEMRAALLAVLEIYRRNAEDWTHVTENAYEAGRRWALEQAVAEIAEALGIKAE
jgi:hypothetical protein